MPSSAPSTNPELPCTRIVPSGWSTTTVQAVPTRIDCSGAGNSSGASIVPGSGTLPRQPMGPWRLSSRRTRNCPKSYSSPLPATTIWSSGTPAPRAMFAVDSEPRIEAFVRLAISPTSMA